MSKYTLDLKKYAQLARQAAAEGCVLLKNENNALPLQKGDRVAVFGRSAFHYYKSGLGSGGLVNTRYVTGILDALKSCPYLVLDLELVGLYEAWLEENPYDEGQGWGQVPWCQKEMPLTEEMVGHAARTDAAIVIIGRTAGEDQDLKNEAGSYLLTDTEEEMIAKVCAVCSRTIILLNVGSIIDMTWVDKYQPMAILYAWQGGQEGGNAVVDVMTGLVNPCGKLTDTIARSISDYPSTANFGDPRQNIYAEDIYVGYRYFETFAQNKVLYPFGYGLSYTSFHIQAAITSNTINQLSIEAVVTNIGQRSGKEVVEVYVKAPVGRLGQPARKLIGFSKSQLLKPGASQTLSLSISKYTLSSYDDSGITGYRNSYVLEEGIYEIYVGTDVQSAKLCGSFQEKLTVVRQLSEACAPVTPFERLKALENDNGCYLLQNEPVPLKTIDIQERRKSCCPVELPYTGNQGYQLVDVLDGKVSLDDFTSQLDDISMIHMFRGEGMCSSKVTPGTAGSFGGLTERLSSLGIPAACCADGPSGIRMDCGTKAFSLPNGTALGCTFNETLVEDLYTMTGQELRLNKIDSLLGPGMNIHRNPLNGRNFEYISEDPLVTGKIGAAQIRGMAKHGIGSTIKHYCGNNQESNRRFINSVISQRALREIYLKGFELAVCEGGARSVMTTYGAVNGLWTAGNYDLCTTILRNEWGFHGIVMTDWWAEANYSGKDPSKQAKAPMAAAQNDLYMVVSDTTKNPENDDLEAGFINGMITRGELQRNTQNILRFLLQSPAILHKTGRIDPTELAEMEQQGDNDFSPIDLIYYTADKNDRIAIDGSAFNPRAGCTDVFGIQLNAFGLYSITMHLKSKLTSLAQLSVSVFYDNTLKASISIQGTEGQEVVEHRDLGFVFGQTHFIKLYYGANGLMIQKVIIHLEKKFDIP